MRLPVETSPILEWNVEWNVTEEPLTEGPLTPSGGWLDFQTLLMFLFLAIVFLLLLLLYRGRDVEIVKIRGPQGFGGLEEPLGRYRYSGLRLELRRAYESILESLRGAGLALSRGATATELSRVLSNLVEDAWAVASIYNKGMFSAEGPSREIVDSMRTIAFRVQEALRRGGLERP